MMVLAGLWAAFLGYDLVYTGVAKLGGDTSCTFGRALRGQCGQGNAGQGGPQSRAMTRAAAAGLVRSQQVAALPVAA